MTDRDLGQVRVISKPATPEGMRIWESARTASQTTVPSASSSSVRSNSGPASRSALYGALVRAEAAHHLAPVDAQCRRLDQST